VLHGLAQVKLELNELDSAMDLLADALLLCQAARCGRIEAQVLHRMGEAHLLAGHLAEAVTKFELALVITSDIGDLIGEAYARQGIGVAKLRQGEFDQARSSLRRALECAVTTGERLAEARALLGLSELALTSGNPREAVVFGQEASEIFRNMGAMLFSVRALTLLSDSHAALGDADAANAASAEADALRMKLADGAPISWQEMAAELIRGGGLAEAGREHGDLECRHPCLASTWRSKASDARLSPPTLAGRAAARNSLNSATASRRAC
jgi:tetratricopeptide (TPR) repeat protein